MSATLLLDEFSLLARAPNGVDCIRELIHYFALSGGLSERRNGDSTAAAVVEDALQRKEEYLATSRTRRGSRKHAALIDVVRTHPLHWEVTDAGNLLDLINGRAFKSTEWNTSGKPIIRIQNLNDRNAPFNYFQGEAEERHQVQNGDMLLSWSGTPGTSFGAFIWDRGDAVLNQHIFKVAIFSELLDKRYLQLAINACLDVLIGSARGGVGLKHVTKGQIESMRIPLPPLEEQKRIVAKVDELMGICDRLESQLAERAKLFPLLSQANHARFLKEPTEENLKAIFPVQSVQACEDLRASVLTLAVTGALLSRDGAGKDARTYLGEPTRLRPKPGVELKDLPQNWVWARVDETGDVQLGRQRAPKYHRGPNMRRYLRVQNVYEDRLDLSDVKEMDFSPGDFETYRLSHGDILLNEGQSRELVGRPAIFRGELDDVCFQNTLIRYRHKPFVIPEYALLVFRSYMRSGRFQDNAKQTTNIAHLGAGRFSAMEFPLPPREEQERIVAKCDSLLSVVANLEAKWEKSIRMQSLIASAVLESISNLEEGMVESVVPPKVEVITSLKRGTKPPKNAQSPLADLLVNGDVSAKELWTSSGLEVDEFYRQLKTEIANGWIAEPEPATVREVEAD